MSSRDDATGPSATHRRRAALVASRMAPLISELADSIESASGSFRNHLDRVRAGIGPVRTSAAFAHELSLALAMVLPLADRTALLDELEEVPLVGASIRALLLPTCPARVAGAAEAMRQVLRDLETPVDPHAWCEDVLQAADERRRRSHGFYLTPEPLARFVVRGVDRLLRDPGGLSDGLADESTWKDVVGRGAAPTVPAGIDRDEPFVSILDPAAGTGVFLTEVLRSIHRERMLAWTMQGVPGPERVTRWRAFAEALVPRLQGIEIMIGPYAVAHLHLRQVLRDTGCSPPPAPGLPVHLADSLLSPGHRSFQGNAPGAWRARCSGATTVVIGNPPFSGAAPPGDSWMQGLLADYKTTVRDEERQIQRLANSYVRFLRLVQWMAECSGVLHVGFVTDRGWGEGVLFRDVRRSWLAQATSMQWTDLGGAAAGPGPGGEADEGLFAIRQPTAVTIARLDTTPRREARTPVASRKVRGSRAEKVSWLDAPVAPSNDIRVHLPDAPQFRFAPTSVFADYETWPSLLEVAGTGLPAQDRDHRYGTGVKTRHDAFVVGMTPSEAVDHVRRVAWRSEDDRSLSEQLGLCKTAHFDLARAREKAALPRDELESLVRPLWFRPFDRRWVVYDRAFVCEPKTRIMSHLLRPANASLAALRQDRTGRAAGYLVSRGLVAKDMVSSRDDALIWPLYLEPGGSCGGASRVANISDSMLRELSECTGLRHREEGDGSAFSGWDVLGYIYAILWSPSYRSRHAEALCRDFPRVPLPSGADCFRALAAIGTELFRTHLDPEPCTPEGNAEPGCRVDRVRWDGESRVWLNSRAWLAVPGPVWQLAVGNHHVCRGWLQARKGRRLDAAEVQWFGGIVRTLSESLRLGSAVDAAVREHGGWTGAFRARTAQKVPLT